MRISLPLEFMVIGAFLIAVMFIAGWDDRLDSLDQASKEDIAKIMCDDHPMMYGCGR